jgi:hypothetical protein
VFAIDKIQNGDLSGHFMIEKPEEEKPKEPTVAQPAKLKTKKRKKKVPFKWMEEKTDSQMNTGEVKK